MASLELQELCCGDPLHINGLLKPDNDDLLRFDAWLKRPPVEWSLKNPSYAFTYADGDNNPPHLQLFPFPNNLTAVSKQCNPFHELYVARNGKDKGKGCINENRLNGDAFVFPESHQDASRRTEARVFSAGRDLVAASKVQPEKRAADFVAARMDEITAHAGCDVPVETLLNVPPGVEPRVVVKTVVQFELENVDPGDVATTLRKRALTGAFANLLTAVNGDGLWDGRGHSAFLPTALQKAVNKNGGEMQVLQMHGAESAEIVTVQNKNSRRRGGGASTVVRLTVSHTCRSVWTDTAADSEAKPRELTRFMRWLTGQSRLVATRVIQNATIEGPFPIPDGQSLPTLAKKRFGDGLPDDELARPEVPSTPHLAHYLGKSNSDAEQFGFEPSVSVVNKTGGIEPKTRGGWWAFLCADVGMPLHKALRVKLSCGHGTSEQISWKPCYRDGVKKPKKMKRSGVKKPKEKNEDEENNEQENNEQENNEEDENEENKDSRERPYRLGKNRFRVSNDPGNARYHIPVSLRPVVTEDAAKTNKITIFLNSLPFDKKLLVLVELEGALARVHEALVVAFRLEAEANEDDVKIPDYSDVSKAKYTAKSFGTDLCAFRPNTQVDDLFFTENHMFDFADDHETLSDDDVEVDYD